MNPEAADDDHVGHGHDGDRQKEQDDRDHGVVELACRGMNVGRNNRRLACRRLDIALVGGRIQDFTHVRPRVFTPVYVFLSSSSSSSAAVAASETSNRSCSMADPGLVNGRGQLVEYQRREDPGVEGVLCATGGGVAVPLPRILFSKLGLKYTICQRLKYSSLFQVISRIAPGH